MRKEHGKALHTLFAAEMKQAFPEFEEVRVQSMYLFPGDRAYCWRVTDTIHCWIVLSPSKKDDNEFTVLVGWSKRGRYPELSMVPSADRPTPTRDEFSMDEYLTRLLFLWTNEDEWWVVEKFRVVLSVEQLAASLQPIAAADAKNAVAPLVCDATGKLSTIGILCLREFAKHTVGRPTMKEESERST